MNLRESMELTKKYSNCPECGSDKIGNGEGALIIEDEKFIRGCKCGWKVVVDRRIKIVAHATKRYKGKTTGIFELKIYGQARHKYVDLNQLKEKSGAKRLSQTKLIEEWLNTKEGRDWALNTPHVSAFF